MTPTWFVIERFHGRQMRTMTPVWFVVERFHGRQMGSIYHERLPSKYEGKRAKANGLVAAIRIDDKPHLAGYSADALFRRWSHPMGKLE